MPLASFLAFACAASARTSPMPRLEKELTAICRAFHGKMGYYVKNLKSGETIGFRQDEQFPSASTIKTAIML